MNRDLLLGMHFLCALGVTAFASLSTARVPQEFVYTVNVTLRDGKAVQCAVNQPPQLPQAPPPPLSTDERVEAEVLATQRLRLLSGPRGPYPTAETAPAVTCFALSP